jgi:hypothetical protein
MRSAAAAVPRQDPAIPSRRIVCAAPLRPHPPWKISTEDGAGGVPQEARGGGGGTPAGQALLLDYYPMHRLNYSTTVSSTICVPR